jgi:GT2 family glycosyltransferase
VFLIDDDSIMHDDCAEQIMRVYEADTRGLVAGVQAALAPPPPGFQADSGAGVARVRRRAGRLLESDSRLVRFVREHVFLMRADKMFVPYDGSYPRRPLPAELAGLSVVPMSVFHGCRMTFRRQPVQREQFEPMLRTYALVEELDASYRVSRHGLLLEAQDARLYHHKAASGRLSRFGAIAMSIVNLAACLRKHSSNLTRDRRRFHWFVARRIVVEAMKDACSLRWTLPQCRGAIYAARQSRRVLAVSVPELAEWYPSFQQGFGSL